MMRAAIAIGSNSIRMLAAEKRDGALHDIFRGREETRLFLGLDEKGFIRPGNLEDAAQAVCRLAALARARGARDIALFATSATRDAKNGDDLARRIFALCGLSLRVISGKEEATLAFQAVSQGQRRLVMDIGGGSTEWTVGEGGRVEWAVSMQLGASRLLKIGPVECAADAERMLDEARRVMAPYVREYLSMPPAPAVVGLGGTCTTSAAMAMGREAHGEAVEGKIVTLDGAKEQLRMLASMTLEERRRVPGLPPARAVHMPHGLCILISSLESCGFSQLTVSGRTNLDAYLLAMPE